MQTSFLDPPPGPDGLSYWPEVITPGEEEALIGRLATLDFRPFEFQSFVGKRRVVSFGWAYRFDGRGLEPAPPFPDWLLPVRDRLAALAGLPSEALAHALLIEYGPGAGLGWHRDRPVFDDVLGLSLLSEVPLRFRRRRAEGWDRHSLPAARRSAYRLQGEARWAWEHGIAPVPELRYSITLRSLRDRGAGAATKASSASAGE